MDSRFWRGLKSGASLPALLLGSLGCRGVENLATDERLDRGLVILLPGIQGRSVAEASIASYRSRSVAGVG